MKKLTKAQRIERAITRAEEAATQLIHSAENFQDQASRADWAWRRNRLLESARRYASAIHAVSRVRAPSPRGDV